MAKKNFLIFDLGASNGRAVVAEYNGGRFDLEVIHRFDNRPVTAAGTLYWDILRLYSEIKSGIQSSAKKYKGITSLGIDTWGADFTTIDKNGKLISNPAHYRDERRAKDSEELLKIVSAKELFDITGASILPLFDLFHMYSLKVQGSPEILNADKFLPIADAFNYFLTGEALNEITRLTTSVFYNQVENRIEDDLLKKLGLPLNIFPPMITPGEKIGNISNKVAEELDMDPIQVVAPSVHDTASAVAGIPVRSKDPDWAFISMGTWFCIGIENEKPLISDEIFENNFSNEAGVEGTNIFVKNINALWVIQQCREKWLQDNEGLSWDEIVNLSRKAPSFRSFINVSDPQFIQAQANMPQAIRDYCKKTGQPVPESIGETARCVFESLAMTVRHYFSFFEKFIGREINVLHLIGGGIQNKLLCKWIADSTGKAVIAGPVETTVVGNLLMQLKAEGEIKSLEEGRKVSLDSSDIFEYQPEDIKQWDAAFERFLKII